MPVMIAEREGEGEREREQADGTESEEGTRARGSEAVRPGARAGDGWMDGGGSGVDDGDPSQRCDVM